MVYDEDFNRQVAAMLERDMEHCTIIEPHTFADKPWLWRFGVNLARLTSPIL